LIVNGQNTAKLNVPKLNAPKLNVPKLNVRKPSGVGSACHTQR
jgi:hypothetical protein